MFSRCVSNMTLFTEIEAKEACDWLKAAGFPQYAQLYEGNTQIRILSCFHMFHLSFFPSSLLSPQSLHPHIPYCVACCSLFSGFSSCAERQVMGKACLSLLGLALLFLYSFFHLSSSTLSKVTPQPFQHSPHHFPVRISIWTHSFELEVFLSLFVVSRLELVHSNKFNNSVAFAKLFCSSGTHSYL